MKAVVFDAFGGPEQLRVCDMPDPVAAPGEIVVDVHAASVNNIDTKVRAGLRTALVDVRFPHVPGRDFSGTVHAVGAGVRHLDPGDEVFGVLDTGCEGTYCERIALAAGLVARKPANLTHAEAAAVGVTGLAAVGALDEAAVLRAGETILIHAGAGGVGSFAIQFAKHLGARVIVTARRANHDYVRALGADIAIDYTREQFWDVSPPCDVVFDTIGGQVHMQSFAALRYGGRLVHIVPAPVGPAPRADVIVVRPLIRREQARIRQIATLLQSGVVKPPAINILPLSEAAAAHRQIENGNMRGKLVLTMDDRRHDAEVLRVQ